MNYELELHLERVGAVMDYRIVNPIGRVRCHRPFCGLIYRAAAWIVIKNNCKTGDSYMDLEEIATVRIDGEDFAGWWDPYVIQVEV